MAHATVKNSYHDLVKRLNKFPKGAPPSKLLYQILEMLFSEKEAGYVSKLPLKPFTLSKAAKVWKLSESETKKILDSLASRGILLDIERRGQSHYALPPPMAGFFEFSLMRVRHDIDQKVLSELFYQYLHTEEDFVKDLFGTGQTQFGRILVNEKAASANPRLEVLDYEKSSEVIRAARSIAVGLCYCRHKKSHLGKTCDAPMKV